MQTTAVVMAGPGQACLHTLSLDPPMPGDLVVDVHWSGVSAGTERLLWSGRMPPFPGMGYPLVPGYESVGEVVDAVPSADPAAAGGEAAHPGDWVFVPGARCFGAVRGLFGGAAARVVLPASRALRLDRALAERGTLLALAATAHHAVASGSPPELVVGHGVLGRLLARIVVALGHPAPTVWEADPVRRAGGGPCLVLDPQDDPRRDYAAIHDASGDPTVLDSLVQRLRRGGEITLAGFYPGDVSFGFAPAFMRELRLRVAAEWQPDDLRAVRDLLDRGRLSLDGLVSHIRPAACAAQAYETAFGDPACLKMVLDWRARP